VIPIKGGDQGATFGLCKRGVPGPPVLSAFGLDVAVPQLFVRDLLRTYRYGQGETMRFSIRMVFPADRGRMEEEEGWLQLQ
jgi:hypothetical protein